VDALRDETPQNLRYLIQDLFYDVTLWGNRVESASAKRRADGKYDVTMTLEVHKFKVRDNGNEYEVVPPNDWIDVGALAGGRLLHRERVLVTGNQSTQHFTVDQKPDTAAVDPLMLLIDRSLGNNTCTVK
jgi:hypothetical protein